MEEAGDKGYMMFWRAVKPLVLFAFFGGTATVIEAFLYALFYRDMGISNALSTVVAWLIVVFFCFITNKAFVYRQPGWGVGQVARELSSFVLSRLGTGALNLLFMVVAVDYMALPAVPMKFLASFLIGFLNFAIGRIIVFRR